MKYSLVPAWAELGPAQPQLVTYFVNCFNFQPQLQPQLNLNLNLNPNLNINVNLTWAWYNFSLSLFLVKVGTCFFVLFFLFSFDYFSFLSIRLKFFNVYLQGVPQKRVIREFHSVCSNAQLMLNLWNKESTGSFRFIVKMFEHITQARKQHISSYRWHFFLLIGTFWYLVSKINP